MDQFRLGQRQSTIAILPVWVGSGKVNRQVSGEFLGGCNKTFFKSIEIGPIIRPVLQFDISPSDFFVADEGICRTAENMVSN